MYQIVEYCLVMAYTGSNRSNHCVTIDCSIHQILDTDPRNPQPFHFNAYDDFKNIMKQHFQVSNDEHCIVMCVYEGKIQYPKRTHGKM